MIKLLHTADWHLGKMFFGRYMLEDQKYFFDNYFFPSLKRLGFGGGDCVVVAGDVFDSAVPPEDAVALFDDVMTRVADMGITLFIISGNRDSAARLSAGSRLLRRAGVYICSSLSEMSPLVLDDGKGTIAALHPIPGFGLSEVRNYLGDGIKGYPESFAQTVSRVDTSDKSMLHILVAHCAIYSDYPSPHDNGGECSGDDIPLSCFEPFDLSLLGHYHRDIELTGLSGYCGSPLGYSFDDADIPRSMRYYELDGRSVRMERVYIDKPLHPLVRLAGSFDHLLSDDVPPSDAYIYAELTDPVPVFEPILRLRPKFPNILGLGCVRDAVPPGQRDRLRRGLRSRTVTGADVFSAFLTQMCGREPTGEEISFFERLCQDTNDDAVKRED